VRAELGFLFSLHLFVAEGTTDHVENSTSVSFADIGPRLYGTQEKTPPEYLSAAESGEADSTRVRTF
jgi:hypothetical protein